MSLIDPSAWNEDEPRFERIHKPSGPRPHDRRSLARELNPTGNMMRACNGKQSYQRRGAERAAERMIRKTGWVMRAYRCRYCGRYHVGGLPLRLRLAEMDGMG